MSRIILAIVVLLAATGGGYFLWLTADEFATAQVGQSQKAKNLLSKEREALDRWKNEDSTLKAKAAKLREAGFFEPDRIRILDCLANLGTSMSYSLTENEWKAAKGGKEFRFKMTAKLPHEGHVLQVFDKIEHGKLGLSVWDSIEISRDAGGLALAVSGKWFGVQK